jgi:NAD-dependent dihydropyrimidine dehydrogenase PreA subunit
VCTCAGLLRVAGGELVIGGRSAGTDGSRVGVEWALLERGGPLAGRELDEVGRTDDIRSRIAEIGEVRVPIRVVAELCPKDHPCPAVEVCPVGALSQEEARAPVVEVEFCIECGECVQTCPTGAIREEANGRGGQRS